MTKVNILIVGCGGIGSYLAKELYELTIKEQINLQEHNITLMDFDKVEIKNLKYQNYELKDITKNKAETLAEKYHFNYENTKLKNQEQIKKYDFIICCTDNSSVRKLIYEYCNRENIYFIDCRAEGRAIAIFTKHKNNTTDKLIKTLNFDKQSSSCQLPYELNKNIIQQGNKIVALICSQLVLNKLRRIENNAEYIYYF